MPFLILLWIAELLNGKRLYHILNGNRPQNFQCRQNAAAVVLKSLPMQAIRSYMTTVRTQTPWIFWGLAFAVLYAAPSIAVSGIVSSLLLLSVVFWSVFFLCINAVYGELPVYTAADKRETGMFSGIYNSDTTYWGRLRPKMKKREVRFIFIAAVVTFVLADALATMEELTRPKPTTLSLADYAVFLLLPMFICALLRAPIEENPQGYCRWLKDELRWIRLLFVVAILTLMVALFLDVSVQPLKFITDWPATMMRWWNADLQFNLHHSSLTFILFAYSIKVVLGSVVLFVIYPYIFLALVASLFKYR